MLGVCMASDGSHYWGIWKTNPSGTAMVEVKKLEHWNNCSHLVTNGSGNLAFFGQYYDSVPELLSPNLGFIVGGALKRSPIVNLRTGAVPISMVALPDQVVFTADHWLLGIEPWYRAFP